MANMKETVRLGRKAGDRFRMFCAFLILVYNLPYKIEGFITFCLIAHIFSCYMILRIEFRCFFQQSYNFFTAQSHEDIKH